MAELRTGGQKGFEKSMVGLNIGIGVWGGGLGFLFTVLLLGADLMMGPFFLYAQAEAQGAETDWISLMVPIGFSIATTGLLYGLWQRPPGERNKTIVNLAWLLAFADTAADVGGFNYLFYRSTSAGENILVMDGATTPQVILQLTVGILCFIHEPLLSTLLGKYQHKVNMREGADYGEQIEAALIYTAGVVLNIVKGLAIWFAVISMSLMDMLLMPKMSDMRAEQIGLLIVSLALTAIQVLMWKQIKHVGGRKALKALPKRERTFLGLAGVLVIIDTAFDLMGFNNMMFGSPEILPANATKAWLLTFLMLGTMCAISEMLTEEIFRPLSKMSQGESFAGSMAATGETGFGGGGPGGTFGGGPGSTF